jgi:hypothetical protein
LQGGEVLNLLASAVQQAAFKMKLEHEENNQLMARVRKNAKHYHEAAKVEKLINDLLAAIAENNISAAANVFFYLVTGSEAKKDEVLSDSMKTVLRAL